MPRVNPFEETARAGREYQPIDRGIANVPNVDDRSLFQGGDDRSLFQRGVDVGKNIYERVEPFVPEYRDDMLNWNIGRFGVGVGRGKGILKWTQPFNTSALDTGIGGTGEYQMAELTGAQKDYMKNPYFSPNLDLSPTREELFNQVKEREEKPGYWWNPFGSEGQEPTTQEEYDQYYDELMENYWA